MIRVSLVEHLGNERRIVDCARVCTATASCSCGNTLCEKDVSLVRKLVKMKHYSPLEHVVFTFKVECPIYVARQIMRHRTASYNEKSLRYVRLTDPPEDLFLIPNNLPEDVIDKAKKVVKEAFNVYRDLLNHLPPEKARAVLPLCTSTEFYMTINLRNLLNFFEQRLHKSAQEETRKVAEEMLNLVYPIVPNVITAWLKEHGQFQRVLKEYDYSEEE